MIEAIGGIEILRSIADYMWVIGEPISGFKEVIETETASLNMALIVCYSFEP